MSIPPPQIDLGHTEWKFIDRATFRSLLENSRAATLLDFASLGKPGGVISNKLSVTTAEYVALLNDRIHYTLFGTSTVISETTTGHVHRQKTHTEDAYLLEQVNAFLDNVDEADDVFYEILPIDDKNFLVVVESGFLNLLTQSKDTLLQFILACLGYLDRFKCDSSQLNRQYLRIKFIEGYHLLVKARAQS